MKYKTFINIYNALNTSVFNDLLIRPTILFTRMRGAHAQYVNTQNSRLEFNPVDIKGLGLATAIIYHEMIHQYIEEILDLEEENHHGPIFWQYYEYFSPQKLELGEYL